MLRGSPSIVLMRGYTRCDSGRSAATAGSACKAEAAGGRPQHSGLQWPARDHDSGLGQQRLSRLSASGRSGRL